MGGKSGKCVTLATREKNTTVQMFFVRSELQFSGGVVYLNTLTTPQM